MVAIGTTFYLLVGFLPQLQDPGLDPSNLGTRRDSWIRQQVRIFIYEEFDEEREHEEYSQTSPVEVPFGVGGAAGGVDGNVMLMSGCKWRRRESVLPATLSVPLLPQDGDPPGQLPRGNPGESPWAYPLSDSASFDFAEFRRPVHDDLPKMTLSLQVNSLATQIRIGSGSTFNLDALNTQGSPIGSGSGGGLVVVPAPPGSPPPPPPPSKGTGMAAKSSLLGSESSETSDDQDTPLLVGPELAIPLKADMTEWEGMGWLPRGSNLGLYGHALFGEMQVFDNSIDVTLYGLGPRLGIPISRDSWLLIDGLLSSGPALLQTGIGDTAGLDLTAGLGFQLRLLSALSVTLSAEYRGFFASDVRAHGPSLNFGFNLSW